MKRSVAFVAALALAQPGQAAILYQETLDAQFGPVYFDSSVIAPSVVATGSTWIGLSGGTLSSASWEVFGEFSKNWWEVVDVDDEGNDVLFLNGNEYFYSNGCSVTPGAPSCGVAGNFRSQLKNNKVRVDFTAPISFNNCFPFDGNLNSDCSAIFSLYGANFSVVATGPGPVTLTISSTRIAGAIPEPASWALLVTGFGIAGGIMRRRRLAASQAMPR